MNKYTSDIEIDAFSFKKEEYEYAYSMEITNEIILNLNENQKVIGLEILNTSEILEINKNYLKKPEEVKCRNNSN